MVAVLRDRHWEFRDRLGRGGCRLCFPAKDFFQVLAEAPGKKFFVRSEASMTVDRGRVTEGEQIEMVAPRSEADPRMGGRTGIVYRFPLGEGEDWPEFAAAGFEAVGLEQVAADFFGKNYVVRTLPDAETVFADGRKKRRVYFLLPRFGQFGEGDDLGFPDGVHFPRA